MALARRDLLLALTLGAAWRTEAAEAVGPGAPVYTTTRLVQRFAQRQQALVAALRAGDTAALERLVAADFEQRLAADGSVLARAEWLAAEAGALRASGTVHTLAMSVHEQGDIAVVSFLRRLPNGARAFIVDIWGAAGDDEPQLRQRFLTALPPEAGGAIRPDGKG